MSTIDYGDIQNARHAAENQIRLADMAVANACRLSAGRLQISGVASWVLQELKKELKNFNAVTGEWKENK